MNLFQALINLYDVLSQQGKLSIAWDTNGKVDYGLDLNDDGTVFQILNFKTDNKSKNMTIPAYGKSDNGEKFKYFCCASSKFLLGYKTTLSDKNKHKDFFNTVANYTIELLKGNEAKECQAICNFFTKYYDNIDQLHNDLNLSEANESNYAGQKFVLCYDGIPVFEYESIKNIWDNEFFNTANDENAVIERSIISGTVGSIARIHTKLPLSGSQQSPLICCKADCSAFQSYSFVEGNNAHISTEDMLKYTSVLKYLVKTEIHRTIIQDLYILSWAEDGNETCDAFFKHTMFSALDDMLDDSNKIDKINSTEETIHSTLNDLAKGKPAKYNNISIDPNVKFYLLGLTNDGRASVKFFIEKSFGNYTKNMVDHFDRLSIPNDEYSRYLSIKQICNETVRESVDFPTILYNKVFISILNNTRYPDMLFNSILSRIKIEFGSINQKSKNQSLIRIPTRKAQILKMILLKNYNIINRKELSMNINDGSLAYNLGKVFAICEKIQEDTDTNKNIGGLYFSTAMTSPAKAFPATIKAAKVYLGKLSDSQQVYYNKLLQAILTNVASFPTHLNNVEQGEFCLGYYHQRQSLFTKKETNEENFNNMEEI